MSRKSRAQRAIGLQSRPLISLAQMTASIQRVGAMDLMAKSALVDRIHAVQPQLILMPIALQRHCPMEDADCVLHIALTLYDAFTENETRTFRQITVDDLDRIQARHFARLKFVDGDPEALRQSIEKYPEKNVVAFVIATLEERGLLKYSPSHEKVVGACLLLLDAMREARLQS